MTRTDRDPEIALLLDVLAEAFERKSWHGTNLRGSLRGMTAEEASWRPAPGRRNAWELAVHAAYWKYAVRRKLTGEKRGSFPKKGSNFFPSPEPPTDEAWKADVALLVAEHRALVDAVASGAGLEGAGRTRALFLVRGAAAHDLYHTGQIQLLKRLRTGG
jgi:hypothetical protein